MPDAVRPSSAVAPASSASAWVDEAAANVTLGPHAMRRRDARLAAMSAAQRTAVDKVLRKASSPLERVLLQRAIAAQRPLRQVGWFAAQIRGMPIEQLLGRATLEGPRGSLFQQFITSCAPTVTEVLHGHADPIYLFRLFMRFSHSGPGGQRLGPQDRTHVAKEQWAMLMKPTAEEAQLFRENRRLKEIFDHQRRTMGRPLVPLLNEHEVVRATGLRYTQHLGLEGRLVERTLLESLRDGRPVAVGLAGPALAGHAVLAYRMRETRDGVSFLFYDPAQGRGVWRSLRQLREGRLDLGGLHRVSLIMSPSEA